jgi:1-deoxy-D-xylulose-5-phosphate synthase
VVDEHEVGRGLTARKARSGDAVCLIGIGKMLGFCLEAAELLAADGIEATVWDPRVIKPLDPTLLDDAARFDHVVTVEDGLRIGGIGTAIADGIASRTLGTHRTPRVAVCGTPVEFIDHAKPDVILAHLGLDARGIAATTRTLLDA